MPGRDGTGPMGAGSMTGRGIGGCTGAFAGRGIGFACRRGFGRGLGRGAAMGGALAGTQKELLLGRRDALKSRLEDIERRLERL